MSHTKVRLHPSTKLFVTQHGLERCRSRLNLHTLAEIDAAVRECKPNHSRKAAMYWFSGRHHTTADYREVSVMADPKRDRVFLLGTCGRGLLTVVSAAKLSWVQAVYKYKLTVQGEY